MVVWKKEIDVNEIDESRVVRFGVPQGYRLISAANQGELLVVWFMVPDVKAPQVLVAVVVAETSNKFDTTSILTPVNFFGTCLFRQDRYVVHVFEAKV